MFKKIVALLMTCVLSMSLVGCSTSDSSDKTTTKKPATSNSIKIKDVNDFQEADGLIKYFTIDEFKEEHGDYWRRSRFISEYYSGNKCVFDTCKQDNDLYIVRKIQIVRNYCYPSEERVEVTDIFPTISKMVKSNRYPYKDIEEKHMIPVTLEKIFEVMKPMYIQKYLANGREYKKEYEIK